MSKFLIAPVALTNAELAELIEGCRMHLDAVKDVWEVFMRNTNLKLETLRDALAAREP
jgi:hypothetical protein